MTPLITIQTLGLITMIKNRKQKNYENPDLVSDDDAIIEL